MIPKDDVLSVNKGLVKACEAIHRAKLGLPSTPTVSVASTWFQRQSARLTQLQGSPTRSLSEEERGFLEGCYAIDPNVLVCGMPVPPEENLLGFAMGTPVANSLLWQDIGIAEAMASHMKMWTVQGCDATKLVQSKTLRRGLPLVLISALKRPRKPAVIIQASISISGAQQWFTHVGTLDRQILLAFELCGLQARVGRTQHLEHILMYPEAVDNFQMRLRQSRARRNTK